MTENQECEHLEQKFNVELERFVCIKCNEKFYHHEYVQGFLFGKNEGIRIGRKEATLAENKRVLDALMGNPLLLKQNSLLIWKEQDNDFWSTSVSEVERFKKELASLRLKGDEKK